MHFKELQHYHYSISVLCSVQLKVHSKCSSCMFLFSDGTFSLFPLRSSSHRRNEHQHSKHRLHLRSKHGKSHTSRVPCLLFQVPAKMCPVPPHSAALIAANYSLRSRCLAANRVLHSEGETHKGVHANLPISPHISRQAPS